VNKQSTIFDDDPPAAPPAAWRTGGAADKETPAAAEALSVAESAPSGDVRAAPVYDWLADYVSGKG